MRVLTFLILFVLSQMVMAQYDSTKTTLVTDRPTQTAAANLLAKGEWQVETGYAISQIEAMDPGMGNPTTDVLMRQDITINTSQLRYGLTNKIELNFYQSLTKTRSKRGSTVVESNPSALAPTGMAVRVHLAEEKGALPQLAVLTGFTASPFVNKENQWDYNFRINASQSLTDKLALGYNLGANLLNDFDDLQSFYTLVLSYAIVPRFSLFGELYGSFERENQAQHSFDYGATYLVNNNIQLDVFGGFDISERASDTLFGFGFSFRVPKQ